MFGNHFDRKLLLSPVFRKCHWNKLSQMITDFVRPANSNYNLDI